jgi:AraC-like DNA-binding protein
MSRRLEDEGTSYAALLENVRQELGTWYVGQTDASFVEIASLLGFAHGESLYRAFKRWTGETPLAYRARVLEQKRTGKRAPAL